jgi:hypothetical protein
MPKGTNIESPVEKTKTKAKLRNGKNVENPVNRVVLLASCLAGGGYARRKMIPAWR